MNFIEGALVGDDDAATIGIRPEHISVDAKNGDLEGVVSHLEHLGADTNLFLDCGAAGLIAVRLFGEHDFEIDAKMFARFQPDRVFRFDQTGDVIR